MPIDRCDRTKTCKKTLPVAKGCGDSSSECEFMDTTHSVDASRKFCFFAHCDVVSLQRMYAVGLSKMQVFKSLSKNRSEFVSYSCCVQLVNRRLLSCRTAPMPT